MSETFAQWAAMLLPDPMACLLVLSPFKMEDQVKICPFSPQPFAISQTSFDFNLSWIKSDFAIGFHQVNVHLYQGEALSTG